MFGKTKQNPLIYLFKKTWRYSEGHRPTIVKFWLMFIIANSVSLIVNPLIWAKIMNVVTKEGINTDNMPILIGLLILTLGIGLFFWSLHGPGRVLERIVAFHARSKYRGFLLQGVMTLPMEWHVEHHSGDTIDKVEKGTSALFNFSDDSFEIIYSGVELVGSLAMLAYFCPASLVIVFVMAIVSIMITMRFDRVIIAQYKQLNHSENNISESVFDAVSNISTVIILRAEQSVFKPIMEKILKPFGLYKDNCARNEMKWFMTSICCRIMTILVLIYYFYKNIGAPQGILVGSVFLMIHYLDKVSDLFFKFTSKYGDILKYSARLHNSEELAMDFKNESFTNHVLPESWKRIDVRNLNFSYHSGNENTELHLIDINFHILRGERIALIGETGSGKTTSLKVIRALYDPKTLRLEVDGVHIPDGFDGISRAIALVPQTPEILATTILTNITLGADYDMDTVKHVSDLACFTPVAEKLPHGFDTSIKEKGVNLSGGQQQRLALARGLFACRNKDIILLDEATSSLDQPMQYAIYRNIFDEYKSQSIIATIHGLHLLPLFDRIYYFDKGKIIGAGTLEELLATNSAFKKLWNNRGE